MQCEICGCDIPQERLDALPGTRVCVTHSTEQRVIGFNISQFSKGTASEVVIIKPEHKESLRLAKRAHRRSR